MDKHPESPVKGPAPFPPVGEFDAVLCPEAGVSPNAERMAFSISFVPGTVVGTAPVVTGLNTDPPLSGVRV